MKCFNTTALCIPSKHYMVDLSDRMVEIKKLIDDGKYFTINRARQYGKTTTIARLCEYLKNEYYVLSLDFQKISDASFKSEEAFVKAFCRNVINKGKRIQIPADVTEQLDEFVRRSKEKAVFDELFAVLSEWCEKSDKPIVMIIDEVDTATNNRVFLDFLSQLRAAYLEREGNPDEKAFQSVILAGVTDVKHIKSKIRDEAGTRENSPWNIAADFLVDMSLSEAGIKGMLDEYESDHHAGMDTEKIAKIIREYTNGYPFLVSRICQLIDERLVPEIIPELSKAWTSDGVDKAVKIIITEDNTLFDSIMGKLRDMPKLREELRRILMNGETIAHSPDNDDQKQLRMYGFIVNNHNTVAVANKIFEMRLYKISLSMRVNFLKKCVVMY